MNAKQLQKGQPATGYPTTWEHYADLLQWLDLKIQMLLQIQQEAVQGDDNPMDPFRGLIVSAQEVQQLLEEPVTSIWDRPNGQFLFAHAQEVEALITARVEQSWQASVFLPLPHLADAFGLTAFEQQVVFLCLAVELHRKYEKLYAYLQDDVTCKHPTVDLILKFLCITPQERLVARSAFVPNGKLFRYFLKYDAEQERKHSLLTTPLQLEERIVRFLLHHARVDEEIAHFAELLYPPQEVPELLFEEQVQAQICRYFAPHAEAPVCPKLVFFLKGNPGAGKRLHVKHFCRRYNKSLLLVDLTALLQDRQDVKPLFAKVVREAILHQAVLCFHNVHVLLRHERSAQLIPLLLAAVREFPGIVFLLTEQPWRSLELSNLPVFLQLSLQIPPDVRRQQLWEHLRTGYRIGADVDFATVAGKFRFTVGQMQRALAVADNLVRWQAEAQTDALITRDVLYEACYTQIQHHLEKKATRIKPKANWDTLILPSEQKEQLQNACNQMKYRSLVYGEWGFEQRLSYGRGLSMLFAGPPGTGKTMAAEVIAHDLHLEIYKIDLSQVVSKYIGETEQNLHQIFAEAQLSSAILFFDEADALFGKRSEVKDSHDKYANMETAYLLQKMEEYEGITILATNFQQNLDEAFLRRLNYVIKFPFPDAEYREKIWRGMFPRQTPLAADVDFAFLAEKFEISGGNIKNTVLSAAFLAADSGSPVSMRHLAQAVKHEMKKSGKLLLKKELEDFFNI